MKLRDLRIQHKITQQELAKRTGIPYESYRRFEYGKQFPSARAIVSLAKLYSMAPGDLFEALCRERGLL